MATIHEDAQLDAERIADKTSKVCKRFLAGLCPYFMLDGTKLGKDNMYKCSKHHDKRLREVYRKSVDEGGDDHGYQETLLQLIEEIVGMIDRRVARDKRVISGESKQQTIPSDVQDAIDDIEAEVHFCLNLVCFIFCAFAQRCDLEERAPKFSLRIDVFLVLSWEPEVAINPPRGLSFQMGARG